ncbi:MAG: hypothetical protein KIT82_14775 [Bradyrhizobium sp.]|nr:hypothetical protein [Bradyrhizobium sp.]
MNNESNPQSWWKWATTPPQSYAIYLATLMLVFVLSFYAGTMKPQGPTGLAPQPAPTVPHK